MSYNLPRALRVPEYRTGMGCGDQPAVCITIDRGGQEGGGPEGKCTKVLSLGMAMSRPKMRENAETISALRCKPDTEDIPESKSSA
jgi:hypothetical protein